MIVKYENHLGDVINLNKDPYKLLVSDLLDYEPEVIENNGKLAGFNNSVITTRNVDIDIHRNKESTARKYMNLLTEFFNTDIAKGIPGRLFINDSYMKCYIYAKEAMRWGTDIIISCEYKLITDNPVWIQEESFSITPSLADSDIANSKGYPMKFPYSFARTRKTNRIHIDHYTESDFMLTIFGPTDRVQIEIAGHPYIVEYPIAEGEYMVIDSRSSAPIGKQIYIVRTNGQKENIFHYRSCEYSVFKKIPTGDILIDYPGTYGFDLTVYEERSEPRF